ncbi:boophilin-H2, partial [Trichonephila clavata]
ILQSDAEKKCLSRAETGVCRALFYKWFYNAETGKCAQFVYGGCGGNENKYDTEEQCLETCSGIRISATEICELPVTNGSCLLVWDRYYFDKTSGECKSFKDGDCGGNLNNFDTIEECNEKCLPSGENN